MVLGREVETHMRMLPCGFIPHRPTVSFDRKPFDADRTKIAISVTI
jgi:hypothetical protein